MQFLGSITSAASGKLGGIVASHGRAGSQFRINTMRTQPRSAAQQNNRSTFAALTSSWKSLSSAQRIAWAALASGVTRKDRLGQTHQTSGYTIYTSCNRHLQLAGITAPLTSAPAIPSIPAIASFSVAPTYDTSGGGSVLTALTVSITASSPTSALATLRASAAVSGGRGNIRSSELRTVAVFALPQGAPLALNTAWQAIFGSFPPAGTITFEVFLTDPSSGFIGSRVRTAASYTQTPSTLPAPGPVDTYVNADYLGTQNQSVIYVGPDIVAEP
jgi:hypothetical protein